MKGSARPWQGGFTYFMLLWWVALSGIGLVGLSQNWAFERRREKEIEMVARAEEIRAAITSYRRHAPGGQGGAWPATLQDLVEDKRGPHTVRHLRRLWIDPLTGTSDWGLVRDRPAKPGGVASRAAVADNESPVSAALADFSKQAAQSSPPAEGGIRGVFSKAPGQPIRGPAGIKGYGEWRFEATVQANGS